MLLRAAMSSPAPEIPDRYTIVHEVLCTPTERIFRAVDNVLHREVLLKLPGRVFAGWTAPQRDRLLREARALAKIRHPSVPAIYSVEEIAEGPLLVLDLPAGESLAERLRRGTLDVETVRAIGVHVANALTQVHLNNVVHRAVGPTSIRLLPDGGVQLGSFTFAKEMSGPGGGSSLGAGRGVDGVSVGGLPDYLAPEQRTGQAADARADIFALGCTLFRCLTGIEAYEPGEDQIPVPELRRLRPDVSPAFAEIIRKCLLPVRTARYSTAMEVAEALRNVSLGSVGGNRRAVVAGAVGLLLAVGVLLFFLFKRQPPPPPPPGPSGEATNFLSGQYNHVYGLFVGIGKGYGNRSFPILEDPAAEIAEVVKQLEANDSKWRVKGAIKVLPDDEADLKTIKGELDRIAGLAKENDAVLFYFAGHGWEDGTVFGLAAKNADKDNLTGFVTGEHLNALTKCLAKHVLIVLDCCQAGEMVRRVKMDGVGPTLRGSDVPGVDYAYRHVSREILCSAGRNQNASDAGSGAKLSDFCQQFVARLHAMQSPGEHITAKALCESISHGMPTGASQALSYNPSPGQAGNISFVFRYAPK